METQRPRVNGAVPGDKATSYDMRDISKMASNEEKASSPLLSTESVDNDVTKAKNALNTRKDFDEPKTDLNTVNSLKTDINGDSSAGGYEKHQVPVIAYYKPEKEKHVNEDDEDDEGPATEGVKFLGLGDGDSICSSSASGEPVPQIPDGGWGWVVVASAFLISTVADGLAFSFGLLHKEFTVHFKASQSKTSLIGSLFISVPLIAGPIMSALVDRYGCRKMTIVGGIASTLGFLLASISQTVEMMCFTFGFLSGLGMGLLYVTAVVSIAYWFDKRRNLAVSLGACGIGFGTFLFSPMTEFFLMEYGWRGTIVLLAGTLLNMCVCGVVMRDPEWWILEQKKQAALRKSEKASSTYSISARSAAESVFPGIDELKSLMKSGETPEYILTTLVTSIAAAENLDATTKINADMSKHKVSSVINLPTFLKQSEKVPAEVLEHLAANKRLYNIILENYPSLLALRSNSEQKLPVESPSMVPKNKPVTMSMKVKLSKKKKAVPETQLDIAKQNLLAPIPENKRAAVVPKQDKAQGQRQDWLTRQLSTNHHYLRDIRMHRNSMMHRGAMMNISKYKLRASSCPNIYRNSMWSIAEEDNTKTWMMKVKSAFNSTFDFKMFTEFHFFLMNMSTVLLFVWFIVPYFYLIAMMEDHGYTASESTVMLSIVGIASIIGIVGLGWAGDQPWVNVTKTYAVCLAICGISIGMYPMIITFTDTRSTGFWLLAANSALFGLSFSSSYSYTPTILMELIPLEQFTLAYGLILLSQGAGHLVGPPLAGLMFDVTGGWNMTFYMAGLWVVMSGVCVGIIPYTRNFRMCGTAPLSKDVEPSSETDHSHIFVVA